ncbi:hypothetical protein ACFODZ_13595 [Marinicella sediminis]|uniref:Uncharacterized protein n=1 Tax=Marinicella sediminis TaxID=1792834 RepID=A0ABV7JF12_9GAMM|nr:hypothetical protein [Marinicella sediminis]
MKTISLIISLFFTAAQAGTLNYEMNDQNQIRVQMFSSEASLEFEHPELIGFFRGPCGTDSCEVASDSPLTLTYQVSGASTCDALDGNQEWQGPLTATDGQHQVNLAAIESNTTFTLMCIDSSGQFDLHQVDITVTAPGFCTTEVYPPGLARVDGVYANYNDGVEFGNSTNVTFEANIAISTFLTLSEFSFDQPDTRRRITLVTAPTNYDPIEAGTISVSTCPGDFSQTAECVFNVTNNSTLFFSTRPSDAGSPFNFCILDPTQSYYINYITTPDPYNQAPNCANGAQSCAFFYSEAVMN